MKIVLRFIVLLVFTLLPVVSSAFWVDQSVRLKRAHGDASLVLANATVSAITKDSRGFMWFATERGLMCYDGISTMDIPAPVSGLLATKIAQTPDELFFLYNEQSELACFDRRSEVYLAIDVPVECEAQLGTSFDYHPKYGLFAVNSKGLYKLDYVMVNDPITNRDRIILTAHRISQIKHSLNLISIAPNGTIYSNIADTYSVIAINPETYQTKRYDIDIDHAHDTNAKRVYRLFAFDQSFWFTRHWDDMVCYNLKNDKFKHFCALQDNIGVSYMQVMGIERLAPGHYALATWSGMVNVYFDMSNHDLMQFEIENPHYRLDNQGNYIENRIICLYYDTEQEILWTGAYGGGVVKYSNSIETHIPLNDFQPSSVTEDKRGYIWLVAVNGGIYRSDTNDLTEKSNFNRVAGFSNITSRAAIYNDDRRHLWLNDSEGDIIQIDQFTEQSRRWKVSFDGKTTVRLNVNDMMLDQKNRLWMVTNGEIVLLDVNRGKFTKMNLVGLQKMHFSQVLEDNEGEVWLGTQKGLYRLSLNGNTIVATGGYEGMVNREPTLVYHLTLNSSGDIIATYADKLLRIDSKKKDKVSLVLNVDDNTLPSGSIFKIIDDRNGNTWFGSNSMIMTMKSGGSDVFTYSMSNNNRDACILSDGRMLWIAENGLMYLRPEEVRGESKKTAVVLSRLVIRGRDVYANKEFGGQVLLPKNISITDTITFYENNKDFTLYFSDLTYSSIQKQLRYKLDPVMKTWKSHVVGEPLSFSALENGTYQLLIKPLFADESEGEVKQLTIIIKPHWYNTAFFKIVVMVLFAVLILFLYNEMRKYWGRLKRRNVHRIYEKLNSVDDSMVVDVNSFTNRKLLIIGSSKIAVDKLTDMFDAEFSVFHSKDSGAGLIDSLYHQPKVIICLMDMPDALECCRKIKSNDKTMTIPIVVIDMTDVLENRVKAILAKADDYLCFDNEDDTLIRQVVINRMAGNEAIHQVYRRVLKERLETSTDSGVMVDMGADSPAEAFITQLNMLVLENMKDPTFSVKRLAELMNTSQSTLYRKVMKVSGVTLIGAIRDVRLRRAGELLYQTNMTIQGISEEVGYMDVATFRRHFVELYGLTPSQFAKRENAQNAGVIDNDE